MELIWLSDLHYAADGLVEGYDPRRRLDLAIEHVNAHYSGARLCVVSGDLVDLAREADYRAVRAELDRLAMPWVPMVGNHDDREMALRLLEMPEGAMPGFVQYAVPLDGALVICLDTLKLGHAAGSFSAARLAWLEEVLAANPDTPAFVFMHHPPMALGLPSLDTDRLEDGPALLDLLQRHPSVRYLLMGHVHRPITGTVRGIPFATMRSVLYQAPPAKPAWNWDVFSPSEEAPAFGVLTIDGGDVQIHYTQFCDFADGVTSAGQSPSG